MKISVSVTIEAGDDAPIVVDEVFALDRGALAPDTVGLRLQEAKGLLAAVQEKMVHEQIRAALAAQAACTGCGSAHRHKDSRDIVVRSLFGTLRLPSPRWWHCSCTDHKTATFSPLAALLPTRTTPELLYLEAKFAGLASYGTSARLLAEVLPLGRPLHATAVRLHTQAVAQRLESELGEEQPSFIDTCQRDLEELPRPDLPLVVGLDGGYVHSAAQTSRADGWFEVIAGKAIPHDGKPACFAYVQTYDTKPKRRLFEVLKSQGMQANQQVTFITDGAGDVRDLPFYLNPGSEHLIDWFHLTMRLTVLGQMAKSLDGGTLPSKRGPWCADLDGGDLRHLADTVAGIPGELGRLKWLLWHGNVLRALQVTDAVEFDLEFLQDVGPEYARLYKAVREFAGYIRANAWSIPNYGERYRAGEAISSSMAESVVNQVISKRMVKKQQMRWTPRGAHLLLQVRTRVLNDQLADDFRRWHSGFTHQSPEARQLAAAA
jgi:hypothetical protein